MYATASRRYADEGVLTASPARLLTMLYDRLVLDLQRGELAQRSGDVATANKELTHAQDIISELRNSLRMDTWSGAPGLASLYNWWLNELVGANIRRDPERVAQVRKQVEPLRDAWHEALRMTTASAPTSASA
ncbi:flagellar protein FliS [Motilibacter rhizosphaerae]|uniref:Flagellar protein FliS n=1 Tax=Motilibacter rhizosphaerae TaxID=598652 RepID=A0A4Q7NWM2_9ACTN|nr:flagellar export chaperone FliS [Motilibacter rhizosphaerae]RZS91410.1 flagellar protein FliS [Motilibacter rhizosphaerae]